MKNQTLAINSILILFSIAFSFAIVDQYFNPGFAFLDKIPGGTLGFLGLWIILNLVRITILLTEILDQLKKVPETRK